MSVRSAAFIAALLPLFSYSEETVSFSRDVLPILSDNCLSCHGQDEAHRKADLRLDTQDGAMSVIKPGDPKASDFLARILTEDADELMPPPKSHKPRLNPEQADVIRRWIAQGAVWGKHWAFEKPVKTKVTGHPVDHFITARLSKAGLQMAPQAPAHTLLRRLSFDLTGLPPNAEEIAAFESSSYEAQVDRLLASPHFGERMAMWWLDAARYADTDGFQADANRTNWPWRDYVIQSFNENKPFDQFTLEQFAGDLFPDATAEQKVATCFHRNHMTNGEGGRDKEESRVDYVIDRVNTTGTVWMGLTLGCTQCHTHKFDPISHADYYSMAAFFNSVDEDGSAGTKARPYLSYQSPLAARAVLEAQALVDERTPAEKQAREEAAAPFAEWLAARHQEVGLGFTAWHPLRGKLESEEGTVLTQEDDATVQASGPNKKQDDYRLTTAIGLKRIAGLKLEVFPHASHTGGGLSRGASGEFILTDIKVQVKRSGSTQIRDIKVAGAVADTFMKATKAARVYGDVKGTLDDDPRNGWTTEGAPQTEPHTAVFALATPLSLESEEELIFQMLHRSTNGDANIGRFRVSVTDQPGPAVNGLEQAPLEQLAAARVTDLAKLDPSLRERLFAQFLEDHAPYQTAKTSLTRASSQLKEVKAAAGKLNVMVLSERKEPRETHVLLRGVWDKHGERVTQDVPAAIAPWPEGEPRNRMGLARWITSKENPLTARVFVNHLWQMCFGAGLVRTPDDFGLQGERPTHPELLDWLAVDFMEHGWDVKRLLKLIVMSEAYRQDSAVAADLIERDPQNRLLARGPRFRLPSWMMRDAALTASGLLNPALGGPPVRPYQPDGVWEENFMGRFTYEPSEGPAQHRRTLYAFWRRSIAPTFLFDSAQRRVCEVGVSRTNTPLQALTLLNDTSMMEAAATLAQQMMLHDQSNEERLQALYLRVLSRQATQKELTVLTRELDRALTHYQAHPEDAAKYLSTIPGVAAQNSSMPALAAHTLVASLVLNLDEAITHE
ncbi:PSD1 and planctomycete cytochrome C domain-containing protein [Prosthecobacter fusiformis]|nr:PSD1 and planctomycete cytochrome C domain-containing protein [Prosthecobacter fusiformis]